MALAFSTELGDEILAGKRNGPKIPSIGKQHLCMCARRAQGAPAFAGWVLGRGCNNLMDLGQD